MRGGAGGGGDPPLRPEFEGVGAPDARVAVRRVRRGAEHGALAKPAAADAGAALGHHARQADGDGGAQAQGLVDHALRVGQVLAGVEGRDEVLGAVVGGGQGEERRVRECRVQFGLELRLCSRVPAQHVDDVRDGVARRVAPGDHLRQRFGFDLVVREGAAGVWVRGGQEVVENVAAVGVGRLGRLSALLDFGDPDARQVFGRLEACREERVEQEVRCPLC